MSAQKILLPVILITFALQIVKIICGELLKQGDVSQLLLIVLMAITLMMKHICVLFQLIVLMLEVFSLLLIILRKSVFQSVQTNLLSWTMLIWTNSYVLLCVLTITSAIMIQNNVNFNVKTQPQINIHNSSPILNFEFVFKFVLLHRSVLLVKMTLLPV